MFAFSSSARSGTGAFASFWKRFQDEPERDGDGDVAGRGEVVGMAGSFRFKNASRKRMQVARSV
jgi:hypothetical protein